MISGPVVRWPDATGVVSWVAAAHPGGANAVTDVLAAGAATAALRAVADNAESDDVEDEESDDVDASESDNVTNDTADWGDTVGYLRVQVPGVTTLADGRLGGVLISTWCMDCARFIFLPGVGGVCVRTDA